MGINNGGKMRKKVTTSMRVHGQMLVGRLRALISTGNERDWFVLNKIQKVHDNGKRQRAAGVTVGDWGGVVPSAVLRGDQIPRGTGPMEHRKIYIVPHN